MNESSGLNLNALDVRNDFLRAIMTAPENDSLQLVFADWLTERGDALGEIIRIDYEIRQIDDAKTKNRAEVESRQDELLAAYQRDWIDPGRMEKARRQKEAVEALGREFGGSPVYYDCETPDPVWLRKLVGVDFLSKVVAVHLSYVDEAYVEPLQWLPDVKSVDLLGSSITDAGLVHLQDLTALKILNVYDTQVTEAAANALRRQLPNIAATNPKAKPVIAEPDIGPVSSVDQSNADTATAQLEVLSESPEANDITQISDIVKLPLEAKADARSKQELIRGVVLQVSDQRPVSDAEVEVYSFEFEWFGPGP